MTAYLPEHPSGREPRVWRYYLPSKGFGGWAVVMIDEVGIFTAVSDYGNYGYRWSDWGKGVDFRRFVIEICAREERDYVMGKLCPSEIYDGKVALRRIKAYVVEMRRHGGWSRAKAREEWDCAVESGLENNEIDFTRWYDRTEIQDAYEYYERTLPPQAVGFAREVLPRLARAIEEELAMEAKHAPVAAGGGV